jgi:Sec-independent protein translocase protein TatA
MNVMFAAMLGGWEIVLILAVVLILFGTKEFKKATREVTEELSTSMDEPPPSSPPRRLPANGTAPEPDQTVPQSSSTPKD